MMVQTDPREINTVVRRGMLSMSRDPKLLYSEGVANRYKINK